MKLIYLCLVVTIGWSSASVTEENCEVCMKFLTKFTNGLSEEDFSSPEKIENKFRATCKTATGKDNRFCYYLGGVEDAATGILGEMSKPISWRLPVNKVCEKLKKKDNQICDLRYEKQIDLNKVNLNKLKVKDLKKILNDWDESCLDCIEKSEFIKKIEELKPKYYKEEL